MVAFLPIPRIRNSLPLLHVAGAPAPTREFDHGDVVELHLGVLLGKQAEELS